ncbi:hypothetical protein SNEBB_007752 [Seison nebaliae]|nr:hypothetical protein SNEBB_007752 [Seison nebaliae]
MIFIRHFITIILLIQSTIHAQCLHQSGTFDLVCKNEVDYRSVLTRPFIEKRKIFNLYVENDVELEKYLNGIVRYFPNLNTIYLKNGDLSQLQLTSLRIITQIRYLVLEQIENCDNFHFNQFFQKFPSLISLSLKQTKCSISCESCEELVKFLPKINQNSNSEIKCGIIFPLNQFDPNGCSNEQIWNHSLEVKEGDNVQLNSRYIDECSWTSEGDHSNFFILNQNTIILLNVSRNDKKEYVCENGKNKEIFHVTVKDRMKHRREMLSDKLMRDITNESEKKILKNMHSSSTEKKRTRIMDTIRDYGFVDKKELAQRQEIFENALEFIHRNIHRLNFDNNLTSQFDYRENVLSIDEVRYLARLSGCERHIREVNCSEYSCFHQKYRTIDGSCNNVEQGLIGAAFTALGRMLPPRYENGISSPVGWNKDRKYFDNFTLPNVREISQKLFFTKDEMNNFHSLYSQMFIQWGQFLDHDITFTVITLTRHRFSDGIKCRDSCSNEPPCFPIHAANNDSRLNEGDCIEFLRSSSICTSGVNSIIWRQPMYREQMNHVTSYIDASNVYSSHDRDNFDLREVVDGKATAKLKVLKVSKFPSGLPPYKQSSPMDCQTRFDNSMGCFLCGDLRANEQLNLLAIHSIFIRFHNYLVEKFSKLNPHWNDEIVYQETRKFIGAVMQKITYRDWLPNLLKEEFALNEFDGYNPEVQSTILNEFATAAFRFGHAHINPMVYRLNESYDEYEFGNIQLHDAFFAPDKFYFEGGPEPLIRGLLHVPMKKKLYGKVLSQELTEHLFQYTRNVAQDLASLNIQRGRDHAIETYVKIRKECGLSIIESFDDLQQIIKNDEIISKLKSLYGNVKNIDLWVGGMLENNDMSNGIIGETFSCIIRKQFGILRDGDRFYYKNENIFTKSQTRTIDSVSLKKIICITSDTMMKVPPDVFRTTSIDEYENCENLEDIDLSPWEECCATCNGIPRSSIVIN